MTYEEQAATRSPDPLTQGSAGPTLPSIAPAASGAAAYPSPPLAAARSTRIVVSLEQVFDQTADGAIWSTGPFTAGFWARYLTSFEKVLVAARVRPVLRPPNGSHIVSSDAVEFLRLPFYEGFGGFLRKAWAIRRAFARAVRPDDAILLRVPSPIAVCATSVLKPRRRPYGVEVVGDPHEVLAAGAYKHAMRPAIQWLLAASQRQQCAGAAAAAYVTAAALQAKYPCGAAARRGSQDRGGPAPGRIITHYSSVELDKSAFTAPKPETAPGGLVRIVTVGTLAQRYKGMDVLIEALARSVEQGATLDLTVVGGGRFRSELEALCRNLGVAHLVQFAGHVEGRQAIADILDKADLFVLASRSEGLPRAMIEAMARGLPCIGTRVGGIPELLAADDTVEVESVDDLASKITEMASSPQRRAAASIRNRRTADGYRREVLAERRTVFYGALKDVTHRWVARQPVPARGAA